MSENSTKMMFVGDPHGLHQHIVESITEHRPDACVLLGDQCYESPIEQLFDGVDALTSLRWIHGNHDTDRREWHASLFDSPWAGQSLHGHVEQLSGVRVAGLGGVFRGAIWHPDTVVKFESLDQWKLAHPSKKYAQKERQHQSTIWFNDYEELSMQRADILVLHEAPDCHVHGVKALSELGALLGVRLIVHGHHHSQYAAVLDSGIAVIGLGLAQVATLDMELFQHATSADEIFRGFSFGRIAKRGGGWLT